MTAPTWPDRPAFFVQWVPPQETTLSTPVTPTAILPLMPDDRCARWVAALNRVDVGVMMVVREGGRASRALDRLAAWLLPDPAADTDEELKRLVKGTSRDDPKKRPKRG